MSLHFFHDGEEITDKVYLYRESDMQVRVVDVTARDAMTEEYLALYEYHCEREQVERNGGPAEPWCVHDWSGTAEDRATDHHNAALLVLWSMDSEAQNPKPPEL